MSKRRIMTLDEARDEFKEELDYDIMNNGYVKFEEWLIDNNYYLEEWVEQEADNRMKEEHIRS